MTGRRYTWRQRFSSGWVVRLTRGHLHANANLCSFVRFRFVPERKFDEGVASRNSHHGIVRLGMLQLKRLGQVFSGDRYFGEVATVPGLLDAGFLQRLGVKGVVISGSPGSAAILMWTVQVLLPGPHTQTSVLHAHDNRGCAVGTLEEEQAGGCHEKVNRMLGGVDALKSLLEGAEAEAVHLEPVIDVGAG